MKGNIMLLEKEFKENQVVLRLFLRYMIWIIVTGTLIFIYVYQSISIAEMEFKINKLENRATKLITRKKKLETEVSFLASPKRIGRIAVQKLKLISIKNEDIIWIEQMNDIREGIKLAQKE